MAASAEDTPQLAPYTKRGTKGLSRPMSTGPAPHLLSGAKKLRLGGMKYTWGPWHQTGRA